MASKHFPVGIETFSKIIEDGFVYVDKTEYIHRLVSKNGYYFLSRPRRFGKSLLLSTLKAFYEGRRDLFDGLAISRYAHSWDVHPVFHLNLVNADVTSEAGLTAAIGQQIDFWERMYGVTPGVADLAPRFIAVIRAAVAQTGVKAAVLIDEYDKPLVSTLRNEELHNKFRGILKPLYATLKAADEYICFGMISGVSRFSRLSIFSDINNLRDISLSEEFCSICGITEDEVARYCGGGIDSLARRLGTDRDDAACRLKRFYDGYHFSENCPDLYNPYSLMCALEDSALKSYWFSTGTPTFLIDALRDSDIFLPDLLHTEADTTELADIDSYRDSPVALLFQTGYLTLKGYDSVVKAYRLGLPNIEVSEGFFKDMLPIYMNNGRNKSLRNVRDFCRDVISGDAEAFMSRLRSFLADIPYDLSKNKPEIYFENNIYIIFSLMGFTVGTEYRTSAGRIDLLVKTDRFVYIIELKLNGTAEDAIAQIEERNYALPFAAGPRRIIKIGVYFSKVTRNIDTWIIR